MKKTFLFLCCTIILLSVSCQKDNDQDLFLTATIQPYIGDAKVHLEGICAHWDDGDSVRINGNEERVTVADGTTQIALSHGTAENYYALFPSDCYQSFTGSQYAVSLPAIQEFRTIGDTPNGAQAIRGIMAAKGSESLFFYNLTSLLCIQVPSDIPVTSITVSARNASDEHVPLCGDGTVSFEGTIPSLVGLTGGDSVTLVCKPQYRPGRTHYYVVVPAVTNVKFITRITFIRNGKICSKTIGQANANNSMQASIIGSITTSAQKLGETPAGRFSVSATQQVCFSQGNLQYIGSALTPYWKFADNQYDIIGNTQNTSSATLDRDLFGWGTSGATISSNTFYPYLTSTAIADYYQGTTLRGQPTDWGNNTISNGGTGWYTPSYAEWQYLISRSSSYVKATVNGVKGLILLPDNYTHPLTNPLTFNGNYSSNTISLSQWILMESKGTIFLPAAGHRYGVSVNEIASVGKYWSSEVNNNYINVYHLQFTSSGAQFKTNYNTYGYSVRLVKNMGSSK